MTQTKKDKTERDDFMLDRAKRFYRKQKGLQRLSHNHMTCVYALQHELKEAFWEGQQHGWHE